MCCISDSGTTFLRSKFNKTSCRQYCVYISKSAVTWSLMLSNSPCAWSVALFFKNIPVSRLLDKVRLSISLGHSPCAKSVNSLGKDSCGKNDVGICKSSNAWSIAFDSACMGANMISVWVFNFWFRSTKALMGTPSKSASDCM